MFKLTTLLALGTAYLFMFAWIEEVSAEGATNGPTTSVLEQLAADADQTVFAYPFFKRKREYRKKARSYMVNDVE
ncbi:hypothetical protein ABFA07_002658 [Porites harrisoni]